MGTVLLFLVALHRLQADSNRFENYLSYLLFMNLDVIY